MQFKQFLATALAVAVTNAQSDTDLVTLLGSQDSLSTLAGLVSGSDPEFASSLAGAEGVTIFAPTNEAFAELLAANPDLLPDGEIDYELVQTLLSYHVVTSEVTSDMITEEIAFVPTLLEGNVTGGQVVGAQVVDGEVVITSGLKSTSTVVTADVMYNNGVVHVIDSVLTIPPPVSAALGPAGLNSLTGAVTSLELVSTIEGASDITLFAPNDAAFAAIAPALASADQATLISVISLHLLESSEGPVYSSDIISGDLPSDIPDFYSIEVTDSGVTINGANVVVTDILVENGVIHVIDAVLEPEGVDLGADESLTSVPLTSGLTPATSTISEVAMATGPPAMATGGAMPSANGTMSAAPVSPTETPAQFEGKAGSVKATLGAGLLAVGCAVFMAGL